jgi:hypothetical protein
MQYKQFFHFSLDQINKLASIGTEHSFVANNHNIAIAFKLSAVIVSGNGRTTIPYCNIVLD